MIPHFPPPEPPTHCILCQRPLLPKDKWGDTSCSVQVGTEEDWVSPHFWFGPIQDGDLQYSFRLPDKRIHWCEIRMFRIFYDDHRETLVQDDVDFEYARDLAIRLYKLRAFA